MRVEPRHTPEEPAALARAEPSGRVARRLRAVRLAVLGRAAEAVGPLVLLSGRQVKTWVARYNAGGAESLADRPGRRTRTACAARAARTCIASSPRSSGSGGASRRCTTCCTSPGSGRARRARRRSGGARVLQKSLPERVAAVAAERPGEEPVRKSRSGSPTRRASGKEGADPRVGAARVAADGAEADRLREPARAECRVARDRARRGDGG